MYHQSRKVVVCVWSLVFLVCAFCVALVSRNLSASAGQPASQNRPSGKPGNLSLQPAAFKLSRLLGKRFTPSRESSATIVGTVTAGGTERNVNIGRRQTPTGEDVTIGMAGEPGTLAWNDTEGAKAIGSRLDEAQQTLIERIVLDHPDQFVLAQLRGASYHTVAHNVRADVGGGENYTGPLWDVVRVDDSQTQATLRLTSTSRLYYINVQTGLIDKIVSELKGETIAANILEWADQSGNKFPSHIVWKRGNETVQEFRLTSVSIQPQQ